MCLFPKGPGAVQIPGLKLVKNLKIWSIWASFGPVGGDSVYTLRYVIVEYVPIMVVFKIRARIRNRSEILHMIEYLHVKFRQDSDYSNFTPSTINGTNVYSI